MSLLLLLTVDDSEDQAFLLLARRVVARYPKPAAASKAEPATSTAVDEDAEGLMVLCFRTKTHSVGSEDQRKPRKELCIGGWLGDVMMEDDLGLMHSSG